MSSDTHDLVVIGAGPAGMAAAMTAVELGLKTVLLDEQPRPGGQIYRNATAIPPSIAARLGPELAHGQELAAAFLRCGAEMRPGTLAWDVTHDLLVSAQQAGRSFQVRAPQLIAATGAIERPSPLPGWTLPGVMNAGAAQLLLKSAATVPAGRVALVGSGPLLLLVACQLLDAGVTVAAVVDTTPAANLRGALRHVPNALGAPDVLVKGLRLLVRLRRAGVPMFKTAAAPRIEGQGRVQALRFVAGGSEQRLDVDVVLLQHGVVPNTQFPRMMRVEHDWNEAQSAWQPRVDEWGQTSLAGLRIAGDGAGIAGALAAEAGGALAALGAAHALGRLSEHERDARAQPLRRALSRHLRVRPFLDALYRPPEWLASPADDTVVCRCEEVSAGRVREMAQLGCQGPNQTKFFSRVGMGPCQGRMCGATVTQILAKELNRSPGEIGAYRVRPPLKPVTFASFAALDETESDPAALAQGK